MEDGGAGGGERMGKVFIRKVLEERVDKESIIE